MHRPTVSSYESKDPVLPATVALASRAGAALDTDLLMGGGTDDTAKLQSVLDRAKLGRPVYLIIDGPALVSGLDVYSNTTIECLAGSGLYLKDRASRSVIRNAHRSRGVVTDEHISIRGCFLNGNRARQLQSAPADQRNQAPDGSFLVGIELLAVKDVTLEHLTLWNMRSFGTLIANADHIRARDIRVDNGSPRHAETLSIGEQLKLIGQYLQTDGMHFKGPLHDLILDGATFHTGDDALAFSPNDGDTDDITVKNAFGPYVGEGPITDVLVTNIVLDEADYGIRLLSSDQRIDRVVIQNVTGTVKNRLAVISPWIIPKHNGNLGSILFSNITVKPIPIPPPAALYASFHLPEQALKQIEQEEYPLFSLNASVENLRLRNVMIQAVDKRPLIQLGPRAAIQRLDLDLSVYDPKLQSIPLQLEKRGYIGRLNWALDWQGREFNVGKAPLLNHGGKVEQLHWINTPPMYVSAELKAADTIAVTFSQEVKAADLKKGVETSVNGVSVGVLDAVRSEMGYEVDYHIAATVKRGEPVTWAYDAAKGSIENLSGDQMLSVSRTTITN